MNTKKTLKIAGFVCLGSSLICAMQLFLDLTSNTLYIFNIIYDIIMLLLSLGTGITYLCLQNKNIDFLYSHKALFLTLVLLNTFNNLLVWCMALWSEITVLKNGRKEMYAKNENQNNFYKSTNSYDKNNFNTEQNINNSKQENETIIINESDFKVYDTSEKIDEEIKILNNLKDNGLINESEYEKRKEEILEKYK